MSRWTSLLEVQGHDLRLVQLAHRLGTLPERSQLADVSRQAAAVEAQLAAVDRRRGELRRSQQRLEDEIASLDDRATQADRRLYSGAVSNPRELQALQDDVASLRRRIGQLEDDELEIMELADPVEAQRAELEAELGRLRAEIEVVTGALTAAETEIAAEVDAVRGERDRAAAGVPADLWPEYEALRSRLDGVAIARLVGATCQGCHLQLPAVELDRIRRLGVDEPVHCEACGRLLVRD